RRWWWAVASMKGMGAVEARVCWFIVLSVRNCRLSGRKAKPVLTGQAARALAARRARHRGVLQAADRNFKPGHAFLAGDRRPLAADNRTDEGLQLRAQRLGMTDRKMPHRIAAVRLEAEALSDLPGQKI